MTLRPATAIAIVTTLLIATPAAAAGTATISGEIAPGTAKLPKSARKGEAQVLAMNIDTLAYGGAASVSRKGRYTLGSRRASGRCARRPWNWASRMPRSRRRRSWRNPGSAAPSRSRSSASRSRARSASAAAIAEHQPTRTAPREYPGEAFGIERFTVVGGGSDLAVLGNGART